MATTVARDTRIKEGQLISAKVAAAANILKGAPVGYEGGYLTPLLDSTAGVLFAGIAYESANNSSGSAGAISCRYVPLGSHVFAHSGIAQTDVGKLAFLVDNNTVGLSPASLNNDFIIGRIVEVVSASEVRVLIDQSALGLGLGGNRSLALTFTSDARALTVEEFLMNDVFKIGNGQIGAGGGTLTVPKIARGMFAVDNQDADGACTVLVASQSSAPAVAAARSAVFYCDGAVVREIVLDQVAAGS